MARRLPSPNAALNKLRDQLLSDLEQQAKTILSDLTKQFSDDLQSQGDQLLQQLSDKLSSGDLSGALGGFSNLIGSAATYLINRPPTSTTAQESTRSQEANQQFRLSQSQSLAEAGVALSKGNKNL